MKKITAQNLSYLLFIPLVILIYGCGSSACYFNMVQNDKELEYYNRELTLPDRNIVHMSEYALPQPAEIKYVEYSDSSDVVLIKYKVGDEENILVYDLKANKTLWRAKSNMVVSFLRDNNIVLRDREYYKLYDTRSGQFVRDLEPGIYNINNNRTLILSHDKFARVDIRTGKIYWEGPGKSWVGYRQEYLDGDWCYVIAEGLHAIKIDEGTKWEYLTSTSFKNVGKEIGKHVALGVIAGLLGGHDNSKYNPDITMNMNSQPLVINNEIYFAARDKIVCLDKSSGRIIWENKIDPELESMELYDISDNTIALVGKGTKVLNYYQQKSDPPSIRLIQKKDGQITWLYKMDKDAIVQSFISTNDNLCLLTASQLLIFDKQLKVSGIFESKLEYGNFINILSSADTIILRTSKGVLGISKEKLNPVWFRYCELTPVNVQDEWARPIVQSNEIYDKSTMQNGLYFTPNENSGVTAYDMSSWNEITKIPLLGTNFKIINDHYIDFLNNKMKIISLK